MDYIELEKRLKRRKNLTCLVLGVLLAVFLAVGVVFSVLYNNSREEVNLGGQFLPYTQVTYNSNYAIVMCIGYILFIFCLIFFVVALLGRVDTIKVGESFVTLYRGLDGIALYVNGELQDKITFVGYYLEGKLKDGSIVHVSLGNFSARLTFSNGHDPFDYNYLGGFGVDDD